MKTLFACFVAVAALALNVNARADVVIDLGTLINGTAPPGGTPWLIADFHDMGANTVQLTMSNKMPSSDDYVHDWLFNLDRDVSNFAFAYVSGAAATATDYGVNAFNGGSQIKGGLFDVQFTFPTPNHGRLTGGSNSVYTLSGTGLTAADFMAFSVNDSGNPPSSGGWESAAEVRGYGGSGSIGAPNPAPEPMTLSLAAFVVLLGRSKKRRASQRMGTR